MKNNKKIEEKETILEKQKEASKEISSMRRIVILTDGNNIKLEEANVAGKLELVAILQSVINFINQAK